MLNKKAREATVRRVGHSCEEGLVVEAESCSSGRRVVRSVGLSMSSDGSMVEWCERELAMSDGR